MIYLSDDYVNRYQEALTAVIKAGVNHDYSFNYIEKNISYSKTFSEFERSNITSIAFSTIEEIVDDVYSFGKEFCSPDYDIYDEYGWLGYIYIKLFFSLNTTFENLFTIFPILDALNAYRLYHEMDFSQLEEYVKSRIDYSYLNTHMKKLKISTSSLSNKSGVSEATIRAIRYGKRSANKLEVLSAMKISEALHIKTESVANEIGLVFHE